MSRPQQSRSSQRRRNSSGNGNSNGNGNKTNRAPKHDIWREPEPLPPLEPITVSRDATALLRSLGEPPMNGAIEAGYTFGSVVERGAGIATALIQALAPDLLATSGD